MQAALDAGFTPSMAEKAAIKIENKDVRKAFMELARQLALINRHCSN